MDQKIWHKTQSYSILGVFNFVRKKNEKLTLINGHFMTISGHFSASLIEIFHKTDVQTVILRCLVSQNLNWIQSYDMILDPKLILFYAWKCIISGLFCRSVFWHLLGNQLSYFKMAVSSKFFGAFMRHIIRWSKG